MIPRPGVELPPMVDDVIFVSPSLRCSAKHFSFVSNYGPHGLLFSAI